MQPGHCAVPVQAVLPGPWISGQYALLIEYEPTAVASTRGSLGLGCLLLVPGGWRGLVRVDRGLLAGGSWGLAVPFPELVLEIGHVGLVSELVQVLERRGGDSLSYTRESKGPFT